MYIYIYIYIYGPRVTGLGGESRHAANLQTKNLDFGGG